MPSIPTTRRRRVRMRSDHFSGQKNASGPFTEGFVRIEGEQKTVSSGHPWHSRSKGKFKGDIGGDFYTIRRGFGDDRDEFFNSNPQVFLSNSTGSKRYYGPLYAVGCEDINGSVDRRFPTTRYPNIDAIISSASELDAYGSTAIARTTPTRSPANLTVAFGELIKDGLPSIIGAQTWKDSSNVAKNAGSEYLNVVFGWQPLIADIKKTASAIVHADELLNQYERDSGRMVRRRYEFPLERSVEITDVTPVGGADLHLGYGVLPVDFTADGVGRSNRKLTREREIVRKVWFSGAYTYYLPSDYYSRSAIKQAAGFASQVLGLELTPEALWNLAPWSWAIDWRSNVGDVLTNVTNFSQDGLVLRYGYVMETTTVTDTYTNIGANLRGIGRRPIVTSFSTEVKQRRRATPFGFGLDTGDFSPRQLAIMVALGISRAT